jgi:hypothetical protein
MTSRGFATAMVRIREFFCRWTGRWTPTELAAFAAGVIVIAVVPGALMAWLAWRLLRARRAS